MLSPSESLKERHRAGLALVERASGADHPEPDFEALGNHPDVPEVGPEELSPALLRAAVLKHGCLLVRGLVDADEAVAFRDKMDAAFAARDGTDHSANGGYHEEFEADERFDLIGPRRSVTHPESMWLVDSPRVTDELLELFDRAGVLELASGYLGEPPLFSVQKSTLRRVRNNPDLTVPVSFWHQDGAFLKEVRALNIWLSLSRCGDVAPGLDLVPTRINHILPTGTEGAFFDWSVSQAVAEEAAGDGGIHRPIFEPGDALLFDELSLHATAMSPDMPDARYAVECWFFGPSGFPEGYAPIASLKAP
jgi:hypothetical protein